MPDYRVYLRESTAPFDGTSPETATYTKTGSYVFRTPSLSTVGAWQPLSIGRSNVTSLVSASSNLAVNVTDTFEQRTINNVVIRSVPFTTAQSPYFLLAPDDFITITSVSTSANIIVQDLTDEQYARYVNSQNIANELALINLSGQAIISAANIISSADTSSKVTVYEMTGLVGQTITITPLVNAAVGTTLVIWNSSGNAHSIVPTGLDEIDGVNAPIVSAAGTRIVMYSGGPTIGWLSK